VCYYNKKIILDIVQYFNRNHDMICSSAQDIMLRDEAKHGNGKKLDKKTVQLQSHIFYRIRYSLRVMINTWNFSYTCYH